MTSPAPEPRRPREPQVPATTQAIVVATMAIIAVGSVAALCYAAVVKGVESALLQISNLVVLVVGILAGLVAGKAHDGK